ncbi:MAG: Rv3235 family protein, partial [Micrococcales bacterium]|nr:Rv3235 family protein [Micrococcales bacterium]
VTALQVVAGARSPGQLARFATPEVIESLTRRQGRSGRPRPTALRPTRVRTVLISEPRDGIVDASVVVDDGRRVRALALRLTGLDGRWVLTELQMG